MENPDKEAMENGRNKESGDRDGRISTTGTDFTGNANANGDSFRTDDGNKSSIDVGNANGKSGTYNLSSDDDKRVRGTPDVEITDGYYFTPSGRIERIPIGHYIDSSGRLRKRRQRRDTSNANGDSRSDRSSTVEHEKEFSSEDNLRIDKPLNIRGGKKRGRKPKEESSKLTMVTMLATGATAIYTSLALLTKHDHWNLEHLEAKHLAEALNDAINTLPEKYYAQVTGIVEKWIPWINLAFVVGAITIPRIEASAKRVEESHRKPNPPVDKRNEPSTTDNFNGGTSLGWNN